MVQRKKIRTALVSVFHKDRLDAVIKKLHALNIAIYSTGGTLKFIEELGIQATAVEDLTGYPSILGGRVKTLHPKVFGGILSRREHDADTTQMIEYDIPPIDLVIVDLYPFESTVASGAKHDEIIEKIDIGGISLIRAAAKNYKDVLIISSRDQYASLLDLLEEQKGETTIEERKLYAMEAFNQSSHYDTAIYSYFNSSHSDNLKVSMMDGKKLRYGENPHQEGFFFGDFNQMFDQLWGKEISYNNLLDIDAAVGLIGEFSEPTIAILKHNNACGVASRDSLVEAWNDALAGDPVSAFGGILTANRSVDAATAEEMNKIFFEVVIAPSYNDDALEILKSKKNRIILVMKDNALPKQQVRTMLNGMLVQDRDEKTETPNDLKTATKLSPSSRQVEDLLFANIVVKHTKSNAIVLARNKQLIASGVGQTSRIDALKQAIEKAKHFKFDLQDAVMASDAFFPFADSVEIAHQAGITAVIQPGGSVRDQESIEYCNENGICMVFTGARHFKH